MSFVDLIPLILQYGPEAISSLERLLTALKPIFDGRTPTEAEIEAVFAAHEREHARLQATS